MLSIRINLSKPVANSATIKGVMLVTLLLLVLLSPVLNITPIVKSDPNGFLNGWNFRQAHDIDYAGSESEYQMYFDVYKGSGTSSGAKVYLNDHCESFPNDINFTDNNNNYYRCWMEDSNSTWAKIWVKITSIPTSMYIYYGSSGQTTFGSNGSETFIFFDDFSGGSIDWTNTWTSSDQSKYSIVGGELKCDKPSGIADFIRSQTSFGEAHALSFKAKMSSASAYSFYGVYAEDPNYFYWYIAGTGYLPGDTMGGRLRYQNGTGAVDSTFAISPTEWQLIDLKVANETIDSVCLQGSTLQGSQYGDDGVYGYSRYIKFLAFKDGQYTLVDDVRLRKYVEGVSHGSWGSEETQPPDESSVYLNAPSDGAVMTTLSVDFKYLPYFYQPILNASLWTNATGSWSRTQWNTTTVQNITENTISHTFTSEGTFIWNIEVFNSTHSVSAPANRTVTIDAPPRYRNVNSNTTTPQPNASVLLYGESYDSIGLAQAWLATNETGSWQNYTVQTYVTEIDKAIDWIARAQDVHPNGGVAHYYTYPAGPWYSGDYDEVTGYIIPTVYDWAEYTDNVSLRDRAEYMADWLVSELDAYTPPNGPWRNVYVPSQMMQGLIRAYDETGNTTYLDRATQVADWIVSVQNTTDGSWTGSVSYNGIPHTYVSRLDWVLLTLWEATGNTTYKDSAVKNLDWILGQQLSNGWFHWGDLNLAMEPHPGTHGLGYTIEGLVECGKILNNQTMINAAKKTANAFLTLQDTDGSLKGARFNSDWTVYDSSEMLTGSAQICITWLKLYEHTGNTTWLAAAERMNAYLVTKQGSSSDPGIDGGLAGSDPINGPYSPNLILSWATKFLADSLYYQTIWRPHGSPLDLGGTANTWTWSNFTWTNSHITDGTTVQWRIYYQDTYGNINGTSIHTFTVQGGPTKMYVDPPLVEKTHDDISTTFEANVTLQAVNDLWGFDFNLTWDNTLITLVDVEFTNTLNNMWGQDNWFPAVNETTPGTYQLAVVSTSTGFNSTEPTPLAILTFHVEGPICNSLKETILHFEIHKLSDSNADPIPHDIEDGLYRITGQTPTIYINPSIVECRKYHEDVTLKINASDLCNLEDFEFEIHYNTTLLDYVNVTWNAWGLGDITISEVSGIINGSTAGSPLTGNLTLITVTLQVAYNHTWKALPGWTNNLTGTIHIHWANFSYPDAPDLSYQKDTLYQINIDPTDVPYTFAPVQGDIDHNGDVDLEDLRTVAAYYDQEIGEFNLTSDPSIDIFDLVVVAANFGYNYDP